jgi:Tol biopolymer transport system component
MIFIERVSVASDGSQGNDNSVLNGNLNYPPVSPDGRYVVFSSLASNLVPNDANFNGDVFVYDRLSQTIQLVSVDSDGTQLNGAYPSISADGRYVAFISNLIDTGEGNPSGFVAFVHDRLTGTTELIPFPDIGPLGNQSVTISPDGRYVAFGIDSLSSNTINVSIYDRVTQSTTSIESDQTADPLLYAAVGQFSGDGRFLVFASTSPNLVSNDTNNLLDVFRL